MNLTQLKAIVLIDLHRSLSKAAAQLFISQASLSISIRKLEEELDCALLVRSPQGVSLTKKGAEILKHARIICSAVNEIQRIGAREESRLAVDVSVGVSSYLCNLLATRALLALREASEALNIKIRDIATNQDTILDVSTDACDLGLIQVGRMEEKRLLPDAVGKYDLCARHILSDPVCIAVTGAHPLFAKAACTLDELMAYPYITNKNPREDAFYLYLGQLGYTGDVLQVNHVLNHDIAQSTHGFWAGAHAGLLAMREAMKQPIGILTLEACRFYYDIAALHKKAALTPAAQKFLDMLGHEAAAMEGRP
ncbi:MULTISPECIES: LysR family transcriptional regulator [unclassified Desulfovibrio]|uniref:LysR family transcriptional regulator n=1 Tax=unclassified Desulfovibrio TaxID=2593640 RepID=UPI0013EB6445|nr:MULTISPECIES: LysR family transcriptional regulator [unclassified Desulfovibrio]